ncbi:MAG: hypothetical protein U5R31_03835 [Acidimicrobiia bacterium]|nr:hypothetical protein [Acidimicrobiia bacterium]
MRINGLRSLTSVVQGRKDPGVAAIGATNKMFWSEYHRDVMELAMDIRGMEGQMLRGNTDQEEMVPGYGVRRRGQRVPRRRAAGVLLLLALRDHLGRDRRDPAQHRRRTGPRAAQGAQAAGCRRLAPRRERSGRGRRRGPSTGGPGPGSPRSGRSVPGGMSISSPSPSPSTATSS